MVNVRVNATIAHQTEDVQSRIKPLALVNSTLKCFIFKEIAILNSFSNTGKLLIYNATCTDISMTYLRVTHLTVWQTYVHARCTNQNIWAFFHIFIHVRCFSRMDCIALVTITIAETVHNDKCKRLFLCTSNSLCCRCSFSCLSLCSSSFTSATSCCLFFHYCFLLLSFSHIKLNLL